MTDMELNTLNNFGIIINYYRNTDSEKFNFYLKEKNKYFECIKAYEILPEAEKEHVKTIEELVESEMQLINGTKND